MNWIHSFVAGFLSVLIFHQGVVAILYFLGGIPFAPYSMSPTEPFGVPQVFSMAFWGGVWGVIIWAVIRNRISWTYWVLAVFAGGAAPTVITLVVVAPLKGYTLTLGPLIGVVLIINAVWALGLAVLMRLRHNVPLPLG